MSYCRWSSDNWRCDLYCFAGTDDYTTHVATNRVVGDIPEEPPLIYPLPDDFMERHNAVMDFLETAERKPIGLAYDGESFHDPDLASFLDRLIGLRTAGYNFPDYVLEDVREEIAATGGCRRRLPLYWNPKMSHPTSPSRDSAEESFSVEYRGDPVVFFAMSGKGWRYQCPLHCCTAWHWIETESGEKHRIVSAAKDPVSITASLKCPCYKGCTWHVMIKDGVATDA